MNKLAGQGFSLRNVHLATVGVNGGGALLAGLTVWLLLDIPHAAIGPLLIVAALFFALSVLLWTLTSVRRFPSASAQPDADASSAARLVQAILEFPYRQGALCVASWAGAGAALSGLGAIGLQLPPFEWVGLGFICLVFGLGSASYQFILHRGSLRPVLANCVEEVSTDNSTTPSKTGYPLRVRLTLSFTALVFFACAFSLLASYGQSRDMVKLITLERADARLQNHWVNLLMAQQATSHSPTGSTRQVTNLSRERLQEYLSRPGVHEDEEVLLVTNSNGEVLHRQSGSFGELLPPKLPFEGAIHDGTDGGEKTFFHLDSLRLAGVAQNLGDDLWLALAIFRPKQATFGLRMLVVLVSIAFLLATGMVYLAAGDLAVPLVDLAKRADEMAKGHLERPIPKGEADELGALAASFETMRQSLKDKIETIEALNIGLEEKVGDRTAALEEAMEALKRSQTQLVHSEKMASLGGLVAGVAHEINNPVNFIINSIDPLSGWIDDLCQVLELYRSGRNEEAGSLMRSTDLLAAIEEDIPGLMDVLKNGAERTRRIVTDLRTFSRHDQANIKEVMITEGIEAGIALLNHTISGTGIQINRGYDPLLKPILCDPAQLNQVFLNLLSNAIHSLGEGPGRVDVRAIQEKDQVVVELEDNGVGISTEHLSKIFDPFFTTKDVGKGTGLGLSICHGIVTAHGGKIGVLSTLGQGSTFRVTLPTKHPSSG